MNQRALAHELPIPFAYGTVTDDGFSTEKPSPAPNEVGAEEMVSSETAHVIVPLGGRVPASAGGRPPRTKNTARARALRRVRHWGNLPAGIESVVGHQHQRRA